MSEVKNPPPWLYTDEPFTFDSENLGRVKPTLAPADGTGYGLSVDELKKYFGIDAHRFGKPSKRMMVPALHGYNIRVPVVRDRGPPLSVRTCRVGADCIPREVAPSVMARTRGITASAKASSDISFGYSSKSWHKKSSESETVVGDTFVAQLFVFPKLKYRVIKQQRIVYTVEEPTWKMKIPGADMEWGLRQVDVGRLDSDYPVIHRVPTTGDKIGGMAWLCPVFTFSDAKEV